MNDKNKADLDISASAMKGPRVGERWEVGGIAGLVFLGVGLDFGQRKYLIFQDGDVLFVITKDEFYAADLQKHIEENENSEGI